MVDDFLLINTATHKTHFAQQDSIDHAIWPPILEKMWAKFNGQYENIIGGSPVEVYDWLLGAPVTQYWMGVQPNGYSGNYMGYDGTTGTLSTVANNVFAAIKDAVDNGYLVGVGTDSATINGLVPSHSWSVLNTYSFITGGVTYKLLEVRNPWGKDGGSSSGVNYTYTGPWNDLDIGLWTTDAISKVPTYSNNANDGEYFITHEDFVKAFQAY